MKNKKHNKIISFMLCALMLISFKSPYIAKAADSTTNYIINAVFNESSKTITGTQIVKFTNNYNTSLNDLVFHLYPDSYNDPGTLPSIGVQGKDVPDLLNDEKGDIDIKSVSISNKDVIYTQDNQILKIKLNAPLQSGESIEVTINFTLKIPKGLNRLGYTNDQYSITNWYPIISIYDTKTNKWDENPFHPIGESNYSDISNYDVTLNVPKGMVVAATGVTQDIKNDNNSDIVNIKAENVRDFVMMMSKKYKVVSSNVDGIKINSYYLCNDSKDNNEATAKAMLNNSKDAVQFFNKTFGKYPYPELDIVETHLQGGAMEYPQLLQMGKYHAESFNERWLKQAVVHETGHQWWYVTVGSNEFKEPFLDEALTEYSTAYFFDKKYGKYDTSAINMSIRFRINDMNNSKPINRAVDQFNDWSEYSMTIYGRGSIAIEDLRSQIGDEKFQKILQTYFERYKFKNSTVDGFLNVIGEVAGDEARKHMDNAMNSNNYYPKNLELSKEERNIIDRQQQSKYLKEMENTNGIIIGSYFLRGLNGESLYIVKPSKVSSDKQKVDLFVNDIVSYLKDLGLHPIVKYDTAISSSEIKNGNLFLIGNPDNNKIIKLLNNKMPVVINKNDITTNGIVIKQPASGIFAVPNPNNKNKVLVEFFWTGKLNDTSLFQNDISYIKILINTRNNMSIIKNSQK